RRVGKWPSSTTNTLFGQVGRPTPRRKFMQAQLRACHRVLLTGAAAVALALTFSLGTLAQEREVKVGYMKNPIQDASLDIMEKWAKANNVKLTRIPMAYSVFMEKVTATLTS